MVANLLLWFGDKDLKVADGGAGKLPLSGGQSHGALARKTATGVRGGLEAVNKKFGALLEPGMSIEAAGKSAVIRVRVPSIDIQAPFTESEPAVKEGIWAAKLLSLWAKRASLWLLEAVR